jgi:hypothetical protein
MLYYVVKFDVPDRLRFVTYIVWRTVLYIWQVYSSVTTLYSSVTTLTNTHLIKTLTKPTSSPWAVIANGPLARVHIYGIVTCHQPDNFGSWSGYRLIGTHRSDASVKSRLHVLAFANWLHTIFNLLISLTQCHTWLMMCSIYIDESVTRVACCTTVTFLCTFL